MLTALTAAWVLSASPRLIATGWDMPSPQQLARDLAVMEKGPFDGLVVEVTAFRGTERLLPFRSAFSREPWKREWFARSVADMQDLRPKRLTALFANVNANPGDVDWFDDKGWATITEHMRTAAWFARQARMTGLVFDPESYEAHAPFRYRFDTGRTFAETYAKARQRGRETMTAMAAEFPDITILSYFLASYLITSHPTLGPDILSDPRARETHPYGLLLGFLEGWLQAAPTGVTLVDGNEHAYGYTQESEFRGSYHQIRNLAQSAVPEGLRERYRRHVQVGQAIYLDAYTPSLAPGYRISPSRLAANVAWAKRHSDGYVWVYGQRGEWWPAAGDVAARKRGRQKDWVDLIPGVKAALNTSVASASVARAAVPPVPPFGGGFANADFGQVSRTDARFPEGWRGWQAPESKGRFQVSPDDGVMRLTAMSHGFIQQPLAVRPGQRVTVSAEFVAQGDARPTLTVGFQGKDEQWLSRRNDLRVTRSGSRLTGTFSVPDDVAWAIVMFGTQGPGRPTDVMSIRRPKP